MEGQRLTDDEIDAWVDENYANIEEGMYHIGYAPFNSYTNKAGFIAWTKAALKDTRDIQWQHIDE